MHCSEQLKDDQNMGVIKTGAKIRAFLRELNAVAYLAFYIQITIPCNSLFKEQK